MPDEPAGDGLAVHVVGDGCEHVSVPHPAYVYRRTPAGVRLRREGDLRQEREPELLIPGDQCEAGPGQTGHSPVYSAVDHRPVVEVFQIVHFLEEVQFEQPSLGMQ